MAGPTCYDARWYAYGYAYGGRVGLYFMSSSLVIVINETTTKAPHSTAALSARLAPDLEPRDPLPGPTDFT